MTYKYASFLSLQFVVSVYQELGIRTRFGCETRAAVIHKHITGNKAVVLCKQMAGNKGSKQKAENKDTVLCFFAQG